MSKYPPIYYSDYLELESILNSQHPKSQIYGSEAHDEMLFIIVHQVYELWFKQILHELDSVAEIFNSRFVDDKNISTAVARLQRVTEIQKLLIEQLRVLETMTPLDFLDFRDYLIPASGFQSFQFRLIENKLGLSNKNRLQYNNIDYINTLSEKHKTLITETLKKPSIFELVNSWLERTPFLNSESFNFWKIYKKTIDSVLSREKEIILNNQTLSKNKKDFQLKNIELTQNNFNALFDEKMYNEYMNDGNLHFSNKAMLAAIFINLYRDEPILHLPFKFLNLLTEVDELFTEWRYRHALMVHRMIGSKIGTGGSSGHKYLMDTVEKHRIFTDLFNIATYLIPRSELPQLPKNLIKELGFNFNSNI